MTAVHHKFFVTAFCLFLVSAAQAEPSVHPIVDAAKQQTNVVSTSSTYTRPLPNANVFVVNASNKESVMKVGDVEGLTKTPGWVGASSQKNNPPASISPRAKEELYNAASGKTHVDIPGYQKIIIPFTAD